MSKHSSAVDEVTVAFTEYAGLLRGLVDAPEGGDSKLRGLTSFKWTSSCLGRTPRLGMHELVCVYSIVVLMCIQQALVQYKYCANMIWQFC